MTRTERFAAFTDAVRDGEPVIFVHGPGTDDAFVDMEYRICDIEECVWEALHAAGVERIAFYSLAQKLYFRDDESLRAVYAWQDAQSGRAGPGHLREGDHAAGAEAGTRMRRGFAGPLGGRVVLGWPWPAGASRGTGRNRPPHGGGHRAPASRGGRPRGPRACYGGWGPRSPG